MSAINRGQEVSLSDSYVLLLQDTIKETRGLRAQVAERADKEDEVNRRLEQLVNKVDELCEKVNNADASRKRKRNTSHSAKVPSKCRNEFRKMYKALNGNGDFTGFDLDKGIASEGNRTVFTKIAESIYSDYGGKEHCPWSVGQLREACKTYHRSLIDARTRRSKSTAEEHKQTCRRQGRKRDKLEHRLTALECVDWTPTTKEEVREVLTPEYTSSDESSYESGSDSEFRQLVCYQVKHLSWERTRLTKAKKALDTVYEKSLSRRVRQSLVPRELHEEMSSRDVPVNFVEWAVRRTTPVGRGVARISPSSASSTGVVSSSHSLTLGGDRVLDPLYFSTPRSTRQQ